MEPPLPRCGTLFTLLPRIRILGSSHTKSCITPPGSPLDALLGPLRPAPGGEGIVTAMNAYPGYCMSSTLCPRTLPGRRYPGPRIAPPRYPMSRPELLPAICRIIPPGRPPPRRDPGSIGTGRSGVSRVAGVIGRTDVPRIRALVRLGSRPLRGVPSPPVSSEDPLRASLTPVRESSMSGRRLCACFHG